MALPPAVEGYCPLFRWYHTGETSGDGFCVGHIGSVPSGSEDPYYMAGCNVWPEDPAQIADMPNCTYTFVWQD